MEGLLSGSWLKTLLNKALISTRRFLLVEGAPLSKPATPRLRVPSCGRSSPTPTCGSKTPSVGLNDSHDSSCFTSWSLWMYGGTNRVGVKNVLVCYCVGSSCRQGERPLFACD